MYELALDAGLPVYPRGPQSAVNPRQRCGIRQLMNMVSNGQLIYEVVGGSFLGALEPESQQPNPKPCWYYDV